MDKNGNAHRGSSGRYCRCAAPGTSEEALLADVAAVERFSENPVADAIVAAARDRGLAVAEARDFISEPGKGVAAVGERPCRSRRH